MTKILDILGQLIGLVNKIYLAIVFTKGSVSLIPIIGSTIVNFANYELLIKIIVLSEKIV